MILYAGYLQYKLRPGIVCRIMLPFRQHELQQVPQARNTSALEVGIEDLPGAAIISIHTAMPGENRTTNITGECIK